jgi:hypothetical protein
MTRETHASSNADQILDLALHDEIKCRAYELYRRRNTLDRGDLKDGLEAELPRVVYAAAELERNTKGEVGETKAVRAARAYLCALTSFIERGGNLPGVQDNAVRPSDFR